MFVQQNDTTKSSKKPVGKKKQNGRSKTATSGVDSTLSGRSVQQQQQQALYLARAQTFHQICGGFHFALLALQWQEKIKAPDHSLECEELRYYHRLEFERNFDSFKKTTHSRN